MLRSTRKMYVESRDYGSSVDFYLIDQGDESRALAKPVVFEKMPDPDGIAPRDATFRLSKREAQNFFEAMWLAGFRSIHDRGSIDTLDAARKEHIADLRKAAFNDAA